MHKLQKRTTVIHDKLRHTFKQQIKGKQVVPNSNPLGIKCFVLSISISFKYECYIVMQMHKQRILTPGDLNLVQHWVSRIGLLFK